MRDLQLNSLCVAVSHGDFDAAKLVISNLESDDTVHLQVLKTTLTTSCQCHLLLHPQMHTATTHDVRWVNSHVPDEHGLPSCTLTPKGD